MRLFFQVALLLALAAPGVAQENAAILKIPQTTVSGCTEELFEKTEWLFRYRMWGSERLGAAERQLSEVVRLCPETPGAFQAKDQLRVVHEELADHSLSIALFYLDKFRSGKGGKAGALSRLKFIIERYPQYSKLDRVLFLLGALSMNDNNLEEAERYYQRLIEAYSGSQYIGEASMQLSAIDVLKIDKKSQPIP
jgi:outer membrane protein assembly factor BamD (BamD/ComL family)